MKVLRYSALAAVAMFAAACGDKVTVAGPTAVTLTSTTTTTTTPVVPGKVNSITVAPAAVTLTVGQAVTLVAAVNADAGVATTHTWSSSDATKVSVSTAGLVTAVAATPGVAVCATSTVNVGVKGCGSVVVTAATAVTPATATIAGVYQTNLTTPIDPTNVQGRVFVQVNVNPGTQVVSKVYLFMGTTVVDSQTLTAAQSAALRYATDNAGATTAEATQAEVSSIITLTVNTAAYNATTGAVSHVNAGARALSVQLYTAGATAATSTATYSSSLTLNNADVLTASWTLPSTAATATDAAGYTWKSFGGGVATLNTVGVFYSGKTASTYTIKYVKFQKSIVAAWCDVTINTSACVTKPTNWDTTTVKTSATSATTWSLTDREMTRGDGITAESYVVAPPVPTVSVVFSDGSSISDVNLTAVTGTSLAVRIDNRGPAKTTIAAPLLASKGGSLTAMGARGSLLARPSTVNTGADSSAMITAIGTLGGTTPDSGVSFGATLTDRRGVTFATYRNAGYATSALNVGATSTAFGGTMADLTDGSWYALRVISSDALGNADAVIDNSSVVLGVTTALTSVASCTSGTACMKALVDKTAPVIAWSTTAVFSQGDTAFSSAGYTGAVYTWTDTDAGTVTDSVRVEGYTNVTGASVLLCPIGNQGVTSTAPVSSVCQYTATPAATGGLRRVANLTDATANVSTAFSGLTLAVQQYIISVKSIDASGNLGNTLTRVVLVDAVVPTITTPTAVTTTLGSTITVLATANDNQSIGKSSVFFGYNGTSVSNSLTGYAAATNSFHYGPAAISGGSGETMGITKFLSFLNVALSMAVTLPPTYVSDGRYAVSALNNTAMQLNRVGFGVELQDQALNTALSAIMLPTYSDSVAFGTLAASAFAGITGGITDASYTSAAVPFTTYSAGNSAMSGVTKTGYVTSATFTQMVKTYRYESALEAFAKGGDTWRTNNYFCNTRAASSNTVNIMVNGTNSTASGSRATEVPLPTVTAYARVANRGGLAWVKLGTATLVGNTPSSAAAGAAGSATGCDATREVTYQYTWTPGVVAAPWAWHATPVVVFLYRFDKGYSLFGTQFGATYTES